MFSFVSPSRIIVFLLCCLFSRLSQSGAHLTIFMCSRGTTALTKCGVNLPSLPGFHAFVAEVELFSVLSSS